MIEAKSRNAWLDSVADGEGDETVYLGVDDTLSVYAQIFGCTSEQARDQLRNPQGLEVLLLARCFKPTTAKPIWQSRRRSWHTASRRVSCSSMGTSELR